MKKVKGYNVGLKLDFWVDSLYTEIRPPDLLPILPTLHQLSQAQIPDPQKLCNNKKVLLQVA